MRMHLAYSLYIDSRQNLSLVHSQEQEKHGLETEVRIAEWTLYLTGIGVGESFWGDNVLCLV